MPAREQRRADRQKRKARTAQRRAQTAARSEARNEAARAALQPLAAGERPTVVTVGAVVAALLGAASIVAYVAGAKVSGERPPLINVIWPAILMGTAAYGMWRARYWAVLGFQVLLALFMVVAAIGLVGAHSVLGALVFVLILAGAGTMFFFMIKAMARIQMPERSPRA